MILALVAVYHFAGYPGAAPAMALFAALFTLAERARSVWWIVVAVVFVPVWHLLQTLPPNATPVWSYALTGPAMGMLALIALGAAARQIRLTNAREVAAARAQAETAANERLAQDRLRIAREVHDVLAHTISAVAVQSAAALDAFDAEEPQLARESVERIRTLTKQASPEVRRAVEYLRGEEAPSRVPQPGLPQLDDLVAGARDAGLDVRFRLDADPARVAALTALTAYRIVQEAVTNVVKHSDGTRVEIDVRTVADRLVIDVTDDGTAGTPGVTPSAASTTAPSPVGYGLRGMRERAAAVGGSVSAGPSDGGGFVVHAELPLGTGTETPA